MNTFHKSLFLSTFQRGKTAALIAALFALSIVLAGCAAGKPEVRSRTEESFRIIADSESAMKQEKESVIVEDKGEVEQVIQPLQVQSCAGALLAITPRKKRVNYLGQVVYTGGDPIYETVDPFSGLYVRRVKISSNQEHVLRLARLDAVLVDGGGSEHEVLTSDLLEHNIRARYPCVSGLAVLSSIRSLKILGRDTRIRPGRSVNLLIVFSGVDKSVTGDWTMELLDFPIATNEAGEIKRVTSFQFPLRVTGIRSIIKEQRNNFLSPWVEISRDIKEIE